MDDSKHLSSLLSEGNSKDVRTAIETLLQIHRNIRQNSTDDKYRQIRIENKVFQNKVWRFKNARQLMMHFGWRQVGSDLIFYGDGNLDYTIHQLLENRFVHPSASEWTNENKFEGESDKQQREEDLRRKAIEQRDKELAEFKRAKQERELIARNVRDEHAADKLRRKYLHPEMGNKLQKGATVCTIEKFNNKDGFPQT